MNLAYAREYAKKFTFADKVVKHVRAQHIVRYAFGVCQTNELDLALTRRKEELTDVYILHDPTYRSYAAFESDPMEKHFHFIASKWGEQWNETLSSINPFYKRIDSGRETPGLIFMAAVSPMDQDGYFWITEGELEESLQAEIENAEYVVVEVNENIPGHKKIGCRIHISQVNAVVISNNAPLLNSTKFEVFNG